MLKDLFEAKQQYLSHFFAHLDMEATQKILHALLHCKGSIFFTGIGKSGLIAQKIAVTMASTGTRALFLSPIDALHGDIGLVTEQDIFVLLSKSGETEELLNLLPHLDERNVLKIGIASNPNSRLNKKCQLSIDLPLKQELCPFDLAPTTSTTIQMIFGDVLAMALMREKRFTIEQYALNHPAGRIGKRATMRVQDLMLKEDKLPLCKPSDKVIDLLVELSRKRCGCLLVKSPDNSLLGVFTDGDLRRALEKEGPVALEKPIGDFMTKTPKWIAPELLVWEAIKLMEEGNKEITFLPVLNPEHKILGLIKLHDILQAGI